MAKQRKSTTPKSSNVNTNNQNPNSPPTPSIPSVGVEDGETDIAAAVANAPTIATEAANQEKESSPAVNSNHDEDDEILSSDDDQDSGQDQQERKKSKKVLTEKKLKKLNDAYNKRGVVYISRIPPHMKPMKLKQMLSEYGEIGRVWCAPEDPALRKMRKQRGKDSGKNFTEGWIEFEDKRIAKRVAVALNGKPMGGSKRSAYHYDLWAIKYLSKFKWDHLTEEINYQKAVREQKLAAEISAAKRERDFYLSRVDKAKAADAMQSRRKRKADEGGAVPAVAQADGDGEGSKHFVRHYGQRQSKPDPVFDGNKTKLSDDVLTLLAPKKKSKA